MSDRGRNDRGATAAALAVAAAGLAAWAQLWRGRDPDARTFWFSAAAGLLLAVASLGREPRPAARAPEQAKAGGRTRLSGYALAAVGLLLGALCSWWLTVDWAGHLTLTFVLGPLAFLLMALGLDLALGYGGRWVPSPARLVGSMRAWQWAGLVLAVGIGAWFRLRDFGVFPPPEGFNVVDEAQGGLLAQRVLDGARPWEWPFTVYLGAATFKLFGVGVLQLRALGALFGILTIPVFHFLVRSVASAEGALLGTLLFAVSESHIQYSWYGDNVFVSVIVPLAVVALLFRTRSDPRPSWYVLLAVLAGTTVFYYAPLRVTPLLVAAFFLLELLWRRRMPDWRQQLAVVLVGGLFVPPLTAIVSQGGVENYLEALRRAKANKIYYTGTREGDLVQRWERIQMVSEGLSTPGRGISLLSASEPFLDPWTSGLFVLGLGSTVFLLWRRFQLFVLLAFGLTMWIVTVATSNLDPRRMAFPVGFIYLLAALGIDRLIDAAAAARPGSRPLRVGAVAALGAAVAASGLHAHRYLSRLVVQPDVVESHDSEYLPPIFHLRKEYRGEYVVFLTPDDGYVADCFQPIDYDWLKPPGLVGQTVTDLDRAIPWRGGTEGRKGLLYLVQPGFPLQETVRRIQEAYPDAVCRIVDPSKKPAKGLAACRVPGGASGAAADSSARTRAKESAP